MEKENMKKTNKLKIKFAINFYDDDPSHHDRFPGKRQK